MDEQVVRGNQAISRQTLLKENKASVGLAVKTDVIAAAGCMFDSRNQPAERLWQNAVQMGAVPNYGRFC